MNEFRLYPELLKDLKMVNQDLRRNNEKKESLAQAPIAKYDTSPSIHSMGNEREARLLQLIDEEMELERRRLDLQGRLTNIEYIISCLDEKTRSIVKDKYLHEMSWIELSEKYYMSRSGLDHQIRRRLEKLA